MTEEKKEVTEEKKEVVVEEVYEPSPLEQTALDQGWVPKEEWVQAGKDPEDWRPAKEFVDRGELYKTIHSTRRDLKQTQAALTALQKHHQFVFEKAHQQALAELKAQKRAAIREENHELAEEIDEKIDATKESFQEEKAALVQAQRAEQGPPPEFTAWQQRNSWYVNDTELKDYADVAGLVYFNKNPGISPQAVLEFVEKDVRRKFPDKFGGKKAAPNAVHGVDKSMSGRKKVSADPELELDEMEVEIMNTLVRTGAITKEQYLADLKKVKKNG